MADPNDSSFATFVPAPNRILSQDVLRSGQDGAYAPRAAVPQSAAKRFLLGEPVQLSNPVLVGLHQALPGRAGQIIAAGNAGAALGRNVPGGERMSITQLVSHPAFELASSSTPYSPRLRPFVFANPSRVPLLNPDQHAGMRYAERLVKAALIETEAEFCSTAHTLVARVPAEKRSVVLDLMTIAKKRPRIRLPSEEKRLNQEQSWFAPFWQGVQDLATAEGAARRKELISGCNLQTNSANLKDENVKRMLSEPSARAILRKYIDAKKTQSTAEEEKFATKASPGGVPYSVEFCRRDADVPWFLQPVQNYLHLKHWWLRSPNFERGMGPEQGGVPGHGGRDIPYVTKTQITDHAGEAARPGNGAECVPIGEFDARYRYEDRACLEELLQLGRKTGWWTLTNQCHTIVIEALETCRIPEPSPEHTSEMAGGVLNDGGVQ